MLLLLLSVVAITLAGVVQEREEAAERSEIQGNIYRGDITFDDNNYQETHKMSEFASLICITLLKHIILCE